MNVQIKDMGRAVYYREHNKTETLVPEHVSNYRNPSLNRVEFNNHSPIKRSELKRFLRQNWRSIFILLTISVDVFSLLLSGLSGYLVRSFMQSEAATLSSNWFLFGFYYMAALLVPALILGLYRGTYQSSNRQQNKIAVKSFFFAMPIIFGSFFFFNLSEHFRVSAIASLILVPIFFVVGRYIIGIFKYRMQEKGYGIRNAIIYGDCQNVKKVFERMLLYPELGYKIKGFILAGGDAWGSKEYVALHTVLPEYPISNINSVIKKEQIECILTPNLKHNEIGFLRLLDQCRMNRINFKIISEEYESLLRFSYVKDIAGISVYSPPRSRLNFYKSRLKRIFDIVGSAAAIILFSPIFLAVSIAILIEDGRPIFFRQKRALVKGMNEFYFYKFRSMVKDAENKQQDLYKENQTSGGLFMVDDDPRVTKIGKFIRKYSLDELPQFFNVFIGNMSLVGPRPLSLADLNNITPENSIGGFYQLRSNTKPGITGLWQISGRREVGFREMVLLDLYYIENKSILMDLEIILETVPVMLFGRGAY